jgi:hypothetical protein
MAQRFVGSSHKQIGVFGAEQLLRAYVPDGLAEE